MEARVGSVDVNYSARGIPNYMIELWHDGLNKHRVIKAETKYLLEQKARVQIAEWTERWADVSERNRQRSEKAEGRRIQDARKQHAADLTSAATAELDLLGSLLKTALEVDDRIDWEALRDRTPFPEKAPDRSALPPLPAKREHPRQPQAGDSKYMPQIGILDMLLPGRKTKKEEASRALFASDTGSWTAEVKRRDTEYDSACKAREERVAEIKRNDAEQRAAWEQRLNAYAQQQEEGHATIEAKKTAYLQRDPAAISDYCELVLASSRYPDYFPQEFELEYDLVSKTAVVDYNLPAPESISTLKVVRYVAARDAFEEGHITEAQKLKLYDDVLYQVALRSMHELFEADVADALAAVAFNGIVTAVDRTTGKQVTSCVMSVRANKPEFMDINLALVDPKACFKALKGVGSARLSGLSPIAPVMQMRRDDARFVSAYEVANSLDEGVNLAAMDWEDFEHLIRELFEKEFSSTGGEVKVTQASRDGGVDAVAFDPDPIRGGKIVIQAKRWTNTVGVAAVRDLFGTVMAEGATKGVLVTTSDYGTDSYSFATGKPLVLLNGANLLHMLAKHGHKARIDIREAKLAAH
jgi:restriction system protein